MRAGARLARLNTAENDAVVAEQLALEEARRDRRAEHARERRSLPDDFAEIVLAADLLLQVDLLARDAILQLRNLLKRLRVVDGDRHLRADLHEEIEVALGEPPLFLGARDQHAERAVHGQQRDEAGGPDAEPVLTRTSGSGRRRRSGL